MKKDHPEVLLEQITSQNKAVGDIQKKVAVLPRIEQRLEALEQDMHVVEASVRSLSSQVHDYELRIGGLEAETRYCHERTRRHARSV